MIRKKRLKRHWLGLWAKCLGSRWDVIVDLRPDSPTYLHHFGVEITASGHTALFIPPAMLHGFQTLEDNSEVCYQMTDYYAPDAGFGARWNDPSFAIDWPIATELIMAERDATYPDFDRTAYEALIALEVLA